MCETRMTRNILHRNRSVRFLDGGPLMPFEAPSSLLTRERNRNRGRKLEIAYHWVQIASPFLLMMLAISLFSVASTVVHADEPWDRDWTVVTMARDGSWGVGIDRHIAAANAAAIRECRAMSIGGERLRRGAGDHQGRMGHRATVADDYRILVAARRTARTPKRRRSIERSTSSNSTCPTCQLVIAFSLSTLAGR